jgi:hypothetical protein
VIPLPPSPLLPPNGFAPEALDDTVGESWRERVEDDERAHLRVGVDLRNRVADRSGDRIRDLFDALPRTERASHGGAGFARHHLEELDFAAISAATASRRSARRAQIATAAPSRASRSAVARPIPADAPVIAITRILSAYR